MEPCKGDRLCLFCLSPRRVHQFRDADPIVFHRHHRLPPQPRRVVAESTWGAVAQITASTYYQAALEHVAPKAA